VGNFKECVYFTWQVSDCEELETDIFIFQFH